MTTKALPEIFTLSLSESSFWSSANLTNIEGDVLSAYSTSASASAVAHDEHQCTGFFPL